MPFMTDVLSIVEERDMRWRLTEPLFYKGTKDDVWIIPKDFVTDFASVPRILQWLVPPTGKYTRAAILHDAFCEYLAGRLELNRPISARDADGVFRVVMRESGVSLFFRWLIWTGVRWGAMMNEDRRPGIRKDLPKMIYLSILYSPFVVPAGIIVAIISTLSTITDKIVSFFYE